MKNKCPICGIQTETLTRKKEVCFICAFKLWKEVNHIFETGFGMNGIIKNTKHEKTPLRKLQKTKK